jgi:hypothetical protein
LSFFLSSAIAIIINVKSNPRCLQLVAIATQDQDACSWQLPMADTSDSKTELEPARSRCALCRKQKLEELGAEAS